jgi:hypothetical protein
MTWTTCNGLRIGHAWDLLGPVSKRTERDRVWSVDYNFLNDVAMRLDLEVVDLRNQVLRLTHENEFMLKLINQRGSDD